MLEVDKDLSLCIMCQSTRRTDLRTVHYALIFGAGFVGKLHKNFL